MSPNCNLPTYNLLVASYCYMTWIILGSPFCSSIDCSCPESPQTPQVVITIILWNMIRGNPNLIMPGLLCILINVGIKLITKKNTHYNSTTHSLAINTENKPSPLTNSWFLLRFRSRELTLTQNVTKVKWQGLRASKNVDKKLYLFYLSLIINDK